MPIARFSSEHLRDLSLALNREVLLANSKGASCSTTIANCNTRKYHGLLIAPQPQIDDKSYVILSGVDETIISGSSLTQLGIHQYPGTFHPTGNTFLQDFILERVPTWTYVAGDVTLRKELLLVGEDERVLIRYTVLSASKPFQLRVEPFLLFRDVHTLSKANYSANRKSKEIPNGVKLKMYAGFSDLHLQGSRKSEYTSAPDWFYNVEYQREQERGYAFREDIFRPGYFEWTLSTGDTLTFSAGLRELSPRTLAGLFERELKKCPPLTDLNSCLEHAAQQFVVRSETATAINAGYHWFGRWGRDTFIALPGLTLATGKPELFTAVMHSMMKELHDGLFPNVGAAEHAAYNSADAPLWCIWALQQFAAYTNDLDAVAKEYGAKIFSILEHFRDGALHHIHMQQNGLLYAGETGSAVTWMDAVVDGKPVTPRTGLAVELNALWYNAVRFALDVAAVSDNNAFLDEWNALPSLIEQSFPATFWDDSRKYLADCVNGADVDWSLRPNQIFAVSLPYSPITDLAIQTAIVDAVKQALLTPRGLRTLSPNDPKYIGVYEGSQRNRDSAYHQGTVWPWLLGPFADAYLRVHGDEGKEFVRALYEDFTSALTEYGIGTIPEIYDGDAPHAARGAISQAWSVAELLRIRDLVLPPAIHVERKIKPRTKRVKSSTTAA